MEIKQLSYEEVAARFPTAWSVVPSSYQNDSCLKFFVFNNKLGCTTDFGDKYAFTGRRWVLA
jgi:hypothetical protein